ncbi:MAG: hypothetical protein EPO68_04345 [Planctomycetota bacterium]|nr:MAG: hypothetical protein EPO68_04345 [Planctomycetota bacterium]
MKLSPLSLLLALGAAAPAAAQTLYSINGPAATITEQTGPGLGPCGYPAGPGIGAFPTVVAYPCPTVPAFAAPPALPGDVAVDRVANLIWATNGFIVTAYTPAGGAVNSFPLAPALPPGFLPVTGMGHDAVAGVLWLSSAIGACAILPPPAPGCGPLPIVVVPPFPLPAATAPHTDIDWDPSTGSLFVASAIPGMVANVLPGGAPGPFGIFPAGAPCALGPLTGLAVDHAAPAGTATLYVSDGALVARTMFPGVPAPPTFYSPAPCFPVVFPPSSGLAFSAHGIAYGPATPPGVLALSGIGQSVSPNPAFAVLTTGAPIASTVLVYYSATFTCPPIPFGANLINIGIAPPPTFLGAGPGGAPVTIPAPLPPFLPIPGGVYLQSVAVTGGGAILMSNGMEISFARP